jgi:aryl-alcohol dehydrogenase-like predicted oxidoreductase/histidinol phosphatase-like enzyme/predicted kinase
MRCVPPPIAAYDTHVPIGLGCMRLSTEVTRDPVRGRAVITAALAGGIGLLNTADAYALDHTEIGHNERLIAETLAELGGGRRVEIATKGGIERPGGAWVPNGRANHLAAAARASRDRLGIAALDLYLLHAVDPRTPLATSVRALAKLRDEGVARAIGLSNVGLTQLEAALAITTIDAVEIELSPWKVDAIRGGLIAACDARRIRVLAYRPLGGPAGVRRAKSDPVLRSLAKRLYATPSEVILAWLCTLSPMIIPLPGATQVASATSAASAATLVLDDEARAALAGRFLAIPGAQRTISPPRRRSRNHASIEPDEPQPSSAALPFRSRSHTSVPDDAAEIPSLSPASPSPSRGDPAMSHDVAEIPSPSSAPPWPVSRGPAAIADAADAPAPEVVVIVGMPASGKSTLAADYEARGYVRLNRDELGGPLIAIARQLDHELARGARRVVVDNTYPSRASRAPVIEIARRHGLAVRCVVLATSLEDAQANAVARIIARHGRLLMPGLGPDNELGRAKEIDPRAQYRYRRDYEPPRLDEGFAAVDEVPFVRAAPLAGKPALIVELDDVVWRGRPRTPEAIELRAGARDALVAWSATHVLAGTTWQPGLATAASLEARLTELLGVVLVVAHCAHPAGPPVCWCRKPMPGLALALAHAHRLDLSRTLHIGKGPADRGFANRAGVRYADITSGWPDPAAPRDE